MDTGNSKQEMNSALIKLFFLHISTSLLVLIGGSNVSAQQTVRLSGTVIDGGTKEPLTGATIIYGNSQQGSVTNVKGKYYFHIEPGKTNLIISFIGYESIDTTLDINKNQILNFSLIRKSIIGKEIRVEKNSNKLTESLHMGVINLKSKELNQLPNIMGEPDPIKILQLFPGIQGGSEAGAGFHVRGGSVDQNLILFDEAVVYNPGHILGFFSVFNPDIISNVKLLNSGIPAEYGGRLSSVLSISSKEPDSMSFFGSIGLISSRAGFASPFLKGKGNIILTGRTTYLDAIIKPLMLPVLETSSPFLRNSSYRFYDVNFKTTYQGNYRNHFSLSGYLGNDTYSLTDTDLNFKNSLGWGNAFIAGSWSHTISEKSYVKSSGSYSRYNFELFGNQGEYFFSLKSDVEDYKFKSTMTAEIANGILKSGIELHRNLYTPNKINAQAGNFNINFNDFSRLHTMEGGVFASYKRDINKNIGIEAGMRYSAFLHHGPYHSLVTNAAGEVIDTLQCEKYEPLKFYDALEPRLSVRWKLNSNDAIKLAYMRMAQYTHLATSSSISLPTDIWLPSSAQIRPQKGYQLNAGYYREKLPFGLEGSVSIFYKKLNNQLEFLHGIIYNSLNSSLYDNIGTGNSRAYGTELFINKKLGNTTGWLSYTLSRVTRKIDEINNAQWYPASTDRRHDLALVAMQQLSDKWSLSAIFVFVSGRAFTLPVARYIIQGNLANEYDGVNNFRMPDYHRMDLSASRKTYFNNGNISEWNFSVYNIYNRQNPFYIFYKSEVENNQSIIVKPITVSLFPVLPSVSWKFKF